MQKILFLQILQNATTVHLPWYVLKLRIQDDLKCIRWDRQTFTRSSYITSSPTTNKLDSID